MNKPNGNHLLIRVTYQNEDMETVYDEVLSLDEYTGLLKNDLQKVISDVESLIYQLTDKKRADWGEPVWAAFNRIRHKLLDKAGQVARIPENIVEEERVRHTAACFH